MILQYNCHSIRMTPLFASTLLPYFHYYEMKEATSLCYFLSFLDMSSWLVLISASAFSKQHLNEMAELPFKGKMVI